MQLFNAINIISYDEFEYVIVNIQKQFETQKKEIFYKYNIYDQIDWDKDTEKYQKFRYDFRTVVVNMFKKVINFYKKYLPNEYIILLEGSYGRDSDRIFSDIDYTLIYDVEKTDYLACIEELINLSLARICNIPRDKVHSIFTYLPSNIPQRTYTEKDNAFMMVFEDYKLEYKCRKNTIHDVMSNIFSVRSYNHFIAYLDNEMKLHPDTEWLYSFKIIENTSAHNLLNDITEMEKKYRKISFSSIQIDEHLPADIFTIAQFKKVIKYDLLDKFYLFVSRMRKIYQAIFDEYSFLNVEEFLSNNKYVKIIGKHFHENIKNLYVEYLFYLNRLEISLGNNKIELSSHNYKKVSKDWIEEIYYADWRYNNVISRLNELKQHLFAIFNQVLLNLRKNYELSIYTFPCSPRKNNSIEKCLAYLMADYIGNIVENSNKTATFNVIGIENKTDMLIGYRNFLYNEWKMNFDSEFTDLDTINLSIEKIKQLHHMNIISIKCRKVLRCACGMVELCVNEQNYAYLRPNLFRIEKIDEKAICRCKKCKSICCEKDENVLVLSLNYDLKEINKINVYPEFSKKQFMEIARQMNGKEIMVSRNKTTGIDFIVEGKKFNIDIDFSWLFIFQTSICKKILAITGHREIFYIFMAAYVNNILFKRNISYLTLPYINNKQKFKYELSRDAERIAYLLCSKINKQNTIMANSIKIAVSKKATFNLIEKQMSLPIFFNALDEDAFKNLCETIKKRQQLL